MFRKSFLCKIYSANIWIIYDWTNNARTKGIWKLPWRRGLVVSSPAGTDETGIIGREIESRQGIGYLYKNRNKIKRAFEKSKQRTRLIHATV
jgi:hypothetical protein